MTDQREILKREVLQFFEERGATVRDWGTEECPQIDLHNEPFSLNALVDRLFPGRHEMTNKEILEWVEGLEADAFTKLLCSSCMFPVKDGKMG